MSWKQADIEIAQRENQKVIDLLNMLVEPDSSNNRISYIDKCISLVNTLLSELKMKLTVTTTETKFPKVLRLYMQQCNNSMSDEITNKVDTLLRILSLRVSPNTSNLIKLENITSNIQTKNSNDSAIETMINDMLKKIGNFLGTISTKYYSDGGYVGINYLAVQIDKLSTLSESDAKITNFIKTKLLTKPHGRSMAVFGSTNTDISPNDVINNLKSYISQLSTRGISIPISITP